MRKEHKTLAVKSQCHLQGGVVGISNQQNQNKINWRQLWRASQMCGNH